MCSLVSGGQLASRPPGWRARRTPCCASSRAAVGCELRLRGNVLTLDGDEGEVRDAAAVVEELVDLIERGHDFAPATIGQVAGAMGATQRPAEILDDVIWRHRSIKVAPRTVNQKRYVDSIREHTVTFGIGPAGPERRSWRSRWPSRRSTPARSTGSS